MSSEAPGYVGPYRLLNVVNTGQTSQIWQAYDDADKRFVGVKLLLPKYRKDREQVGYLRWEHSVGTKLLHQRIIRILDFGSDRGTSYLSMEWFSAPNLKNWIRQGPGTFAHLIPGIIVQATEALAFMNQQGWVHRDIKPDNFLVSEEGAVKLIDFALATRLRKGLGKLFASRTKVQGTRSYMAPEQILGKPVDDRADLYSLACTFHELLSGKPPFTGANANDLLNKHLRSAPPSLEAANDNVTPEFAALLRRGMAKNPAERPQSVGDFLTSIRMARVFRRMPQPPKTDGPKASD